MFPPLQALTRESDGLFIGSCADEPFISLDVSKMSQAVP